MRLFDLTPKITITVTSGKKHLGLLFSPEATLKRTFDDCITVNKSPLKYEVLSYNWSGPAYDSVSTTTTDTKTNSKTKKKTKTTGRLAGAAIGTLLLPGAGTAAGALLGTGSKSVQKGKGASKGFSNTITHGVEASSSATMQLRIAGSSEVFTIGFKCNSKLDAELQTFLSDIIGGSSFLNSDEETDEPVAQPISESDTIQILKEYKKLLDDGVITQEAFDKKKSELL